MRVRGDESSAKATVHKFFSWRQNCIGTMLKRGCWAPEVSECCEVLWWAAAKHCVIMFFGIEHEAYKNRKNTPGPSCCAQPRPPNPAEVHVIYFPFSAHSLPVRPSVAGAYPLLLWRSQRLLLPFTQSLTSFLICSLCRTVGPVGAWLGVHSVPSLYLEWCPAPGRYLAEVSRKWTQ